MPLLLLFSGSNAVTYTLSPTGAITPVGALVNATAKVLAGSITPTGALTKTVSIRLNGAITPAGAIAKSVNRALGGAIAPTGSLTKSVAKALTGSVTPTGALVDTPSKTLSGAIVPAGALVATASKVLMGDITPAGTLVNAVSKALTGTITPSGSLTRSPARVLAGDLAPTGALTKGTLARLSGEVTLSGEDRNSSALALGGAITPSGTVATSLSKALAGSLGAVGDLIQTVVKVLAGDVTPASDVTKETLLHLTGVVTPAGALSVGSALSAMLTGSIGSTGALVKAAAKRLSGSIMPTGADIETPSVTPPPPTPVVPSGVEGGGRWTPRDAWQPEPRHIELALSGSIKAVGDLIVTVLRGQRAEPRVGMTETFRHDEPFYPAVAASAAVEEELQPARRVTRAERAERRAMQLHAIAKPVPARETAPEGHVVHISATTEQPVPDDALTVVLSTPVPDGPILVATLPRWPRLRKTTPAAEPEPVAEAVEVEEASTRLPLYSREELMSLARRMRIGFHAPDSDRLTAPAPAEPVLSGGEGAARAVRGRRRAPRRPRERPSSRARD